MLLELQVKGKQIYAPLKSEWIKYSQEEKVKQEFIIRLVNFYGYDVDQLGQDVEIKNKVKVDIAIWKNSAEKQKNKIPSIIIAVECKADHVSIKQEDILLSYKIASSVNANFFIATNLKETKVYHILQEPISRKFEKLRDIPSADKIIDDRTLNGYIQETKTFTRDEFSKLLFKCHNIIRNNDKLSPEAAFDEISKILFMKIMYEKKSTEELIFSLDKFKSLERNYEETVRPTLKKANPNFDLDYMQFQFDETKRNFEKDEIFENSDRIRIRKTSFEQIVKELESFNLSDTSDDVKGIAFEEFLGKTFRGELGQFFTPRTIVDYMVEIIDTKEGEIICDPCCGSGGFLIKVFEYIREQIEKDIQKTKEHFNSEILKNQKDGKSPVTKTSDQNKLESIFNQLNTELNISNVNGRLRSLSYDCIFGTDANPRMARTAKMNMIMHGDGHGGVHHHDGLLDVNGIFKERFDVILTNPPFGARVEKSLRVSELDIPSEEKISAYADKYKEYNYLENVVKPLKEWANFEKGKIKGKPIIELFETGNFSSLTEVLFIERCLNLLKPGGRLGIVLPEGVLNNSALQRVREFVEGRAKIINITSIPQDVFIASGATIKPSLLFLTKFTNQELNLYNTIFDRVSKAVHEKYQDRIDDITNEFKSNIDPSVNSFNKQTKKDLKKEYEQALKQIQQERDDEIKFLVKEEFDYPIAIVEVSKAGISSTGAPCENELIEVSKEFRKYVSENPLWNYTMMDVSYSLSNKGEVIRNFTGISIPLTTEDIHG